MERYTFRSSDREMNYALESLGIMIRLDIGTNTSTVECPRFAWEEAVKLANSLKMGEHVHRADHMCIISDCPQDKRDFYYDTLVYYKKRINSKDIVECGNIRCMIEQYKHLLDELDKSRRLGAVPIMPVQTVSEPEGSGLSFSSFIDESYTRIQTARSNARASTETDRIITSLLDEFGA